MDYVLSKYAHAIKKCCMSCGYKQPFNESARKCSFKNKIVDPTDVCEKYVLRAGLYEAGSANGTVKPKSYLYKKLLQVLEEEKTSETHRG